MDVVLAVIFNICFFISIMGFAYFRYQSEKQRGASFETQAKEMGLTFAHEPDKTLVKRYSHFGFLSEGRYGLINNLIEGDTGEVALQIFDYSYRIGSGRKDSKRKQTVVSLKSSQLNIPNLTIHPKGYFRQTSSMAHQDIQIASHPTFSEMFVLNSDDEQVVRNFLKPAALEYFENHRIWLEASGDTFIIYKLGHRIKPDEIENFLSQAYDVYNVLTAQA